MGKAYALPLFPLPFLPFLLFFFFFSFGGFHSLYAQSETTLQRAVKLHLAQKRSWLLLIHYRSTLWGGWKSEVDDPDFFLSPQGKSDPQKELEATIQAYFNDHLKVFSNPHQPPPACRFIARYAWLRAQLGASAFPQRSCPLYEQWLRAIQLRYISLVFPTYDLYKPGSMFGHTLFRFNNKTVQGAQLLDFSASFGAAVDDDNEPMLSLIFNGIFGGFQGSFYVAPFYKKVAEYSEVDVRDLWDYELALNDKEMEILLQHLFEISFSPFRYYFFSENCSYHLLGLLEVARPSLRLKESFPLWATPTDTLRQVIQKVGVRGEPQYRPSRLSRFKHRRQKLSPLEKNWYLILLEKPKKAQDIAFTQLALSSQAKILETLIDALSLQTQSEAKAQKRAWILQRARLQIILPEEDITPNSTPPHLGHGTSKFSLGGGSEEKQSWTQLQVKLAFHDFLDPVTGFSPYSRIDFGTLVLRQAEGQAYLQRLDLIQAESLLPWDEINHHPNWRIFVGWKEFRAQGERRLPLRLEGGIGSSYELAWGQSYHLLLSEIYLHPAFADSFQASLGMENGWLVRAGDFLAARIWWKARPWQKEALQAQNQLGLEASFHPQDSWELRFSVQQEQTQETQALLLLGVYF